MLENTHICWGQSRHLMSFYTSKGKFQIHTTGIRCWNSDSDLWGRHWQTLRYHTLDNKSPSVRNGVHFKKAADCSFIGRFAARLITAENFTWSWTNRWRRTRPQWLESYDSPFIWLRLVLLTIHSTGILITLIHAACTNRPALIEDQLWIDFPLLHLAGTY